MCLVFNELRGDSTVDVFAAGRNGTDAFEEFAERAAFQHISGAADTEHLLDVPGCAMTREHECAGVGTTSSNRMQHLNTCETGQGQVEHQHVRRKLLSALNGRSSIGRFADHFHIQLKIDDRFQPFSYGIMIFSEHDPVFHHGSVPSDRCAVAHSPVHGAFRGMRCPNNRCHRPSFSMLVGDRQ